jgi:hypothetical protein
MLSKCANPHCSVPFRRLNEGKLFCLESDQRNSQHKSNRVEYFWLCRSCSLTMTLRFDADGTVAATPLQAPPAQRSATIIDLGRERGLFLHSVEFPGLRHFSLTIGKRYQHQHRAA